MKKIFTFCISLLTILVLQAQPGMNSMNRSGSLSVTSMSDRPMRVVVNGRTVNGWHGHDNEVYLDDLRPGFYSVRIFQQRSRGRWSGQSNNSNMQVVYDARLTIRGRTHIDIVINRFGRVFIDERTWGTNWNEWDNEWNDNNWNNNNQWNNNPWNNQPFPNNVMDQATFSSFLQTLRNESFDNTRQTLAKQTINANNFTSAQIKEIVEVFAYENSKLDIAKYAYNRCVDKNNYFIISQALTYSSSKEELARFIQQNN